jgi:hypothetical protein
MVPLAAEPSGTVIKLALITAPVVALYMPTPDTFTTKSVLPFTATPTGKLPTTVGSEVLGR